MTADSERSEVVVEGYKKHKLAHSALHRIHQLINGFEHERAADLRLARIGITIIILLLGVAAYFFFGSDSLTIS